MKKFFKKLVFVFSLIFLWNMFLVSLSFAHAKNVEQQIREQQKDQQDKQEKIAESIKLFQTFWQAVYTISWPLIVISWKFMDNDVIYGSFIWMDALLWKIWNVMRTFANYLIWFILIFSIFTLFLWWKLEQYNPIKIIPQLAIATVLVNASWFLIWAMIDIANIMTYSIWTLPLQLADKESVKNQEVPKFWIKFQWKSNFKVWVMDGDKLLPFCEYKPLTDQTWKYIAKGDCVFENQWKYYPYSSWDTIDINNLPNPIKSNTFWHIQEKLWWMTWVLWTMYASLINIWHTVSYPSWSSVAMLWDLIFKLFFLLALLIPLLTLAIILIVRAVLLWMFIIISPIVFLFTPIKNFEKLLWEKWKLVNLVSLIFLPVVVVFALSISFVFLSYLKFQPNSIEKTFWIELKGSTATIPLDWKDGKNKINISYKWDDSASLFANLGSTFAWLIESVFAIAFMWIIVFSALKTSKLTSWIAQSINNFSINMAKAVPIVPMAGWQSISSLGQWIKQVKDLPQTKQSEQYTEKLMPFIEEMQRTMTWSESKYIDIANKNIKEATTDFDNKIDNYNPTPTSTSFASTKINELLKEEEKLKKLSKELGIWTFELESILQKQVKKWNWENKLSTVFNNIKDDLKKAYEELTIKTLKEIIDKNVLSKNITLLQLDEDAKNKLKQLFKKVWITISGAIDQNQETVQALKKLWYQKSEIIQLLAKNVLWQGKVSSEDEKAVWKLVDSLS